MTSRFLNISFFSLGLLIFSPLSAQYVFVFDLPANEAKTFSRSNNYIDFNLDSTGIDPVESSIVELGLLSKLGAGSQSISETKSSPNSIDFIELMNEAIGYDFPDLPISDTDLTQNETLKSVNPQLLDGAATSKPKDFLPDGTGSNLLEQISAFLEGFLIFDNNASTPIQFSFRTKDHLNENYRSGWIEYQYLEAIQNLPHPFSNNLRHPFDVPAQSMASHETNTATNNSPEFTFNEKSLLLPFPHFTPIYKEPSKFSFNPFQQNSFEPLDSSTFFIVQEEKGSNLQHIQSNRQRRANWNSTNTYTWEINDFDPTNTSANPSGLFVVWDVNEELTNFDVTPNDGEIEIYITAANGVDSISILAYGTTGGNAMNDYLGNNGFHFMTATGWGASGDVTDKFSLETSGVDQWLNGYDSSTIWGVHKAGNEFYLTYNFSSLNFSPVPEPSTYFMTGALFCLIGCNRASRRSLKKLLIPILRKSLVTVHSTKEKNPHS